MSKNIICCMLLAAVCLRADAQYPVVDSLRSLFNKIDNIPADEMSSCKKFTTYKSSLSKIDLLSFRLALVGFISADSQFIAANKGKGCPASKIVSDLDSLLKSAGEQDSLAVMHAFLYIKYRVLDSEYVQLNLAFVDSNNVPIARPGWSLNSFGPFIAAPIAAGDKRAEIFILKGMSYDLSVADSGWLPYRMRIVTRTDTTINIKLAASPQPAAVSVPVISRGHETKKSFWWIPAILLALVLAALLRKMSLDKRYRDFPSDATDRQRGSELPSDGDQGKAEETIALLNKQLREKEALVNQYAGEIQAFRRPSTGTSNRFFLAEMMMTAGPRKKPMSEINSDKDLGEDVCGFLKIGDDVVAWLLDGTSDFYCLRNPETHREYFSSRLLAQSIARELKSHYANGEPEPFDQAMTRIIDDVKTNWLSAILLLPDSEKDILKTNIKSGNFPECATTVLIGRLSLDGTLTVYRSGDSKMLVYKKSEDDMMFLDTALSGKNPKSNDRVFFRIVLTDKGELDILHNRPIYEIVRLDGIQTIVGISDGVGQETENDLKKKYPLHSEEIRKEIIYQLQGTEDDKSLYIIEIKEPAPESRANKT